MIQKTLAHQCSLFYVYACISENSFYKLFNASLAVPHSVAFVLNPSIFPSILLVTVLHLLVFMTLKLFEILSMHSLKIDAVTLPLQNFCHCEYLLCFRVIFSIMSLSSIVI